MTQRAHLFNALNNCQTNNGNKVISIKNNIE